MYKIHKPKKLVKGDKIALITPSGPLNDHRFSMDHLKPTIARIEELGFRCVIGENVGKAFKIWAGTAQERADDFEQAFCDPEVKAIFCIRGGSVSIEMAYILDYEKLSARVAAYGAPVFIGYSDITTLHQVLLKKLGMISFHGINALQLAADDLPQYVVDSLIDNVTSTEPVGSVLKRCDHDPTIVSIKEGAAHGRLIGGNLATLCSLMGTDFEPDIDEPLILYIEDVGELPHKVNRCLNQLIGAKFFKNVVGVVGGNFFDNVVHGEEKPKFSLEFMRMVFEGKFSDRNIPVALGFPIGHSRDNVTIPNGAMAHLVVGEGGADLELLEAAVVK